MEDQVAETAHWNNRTVFVTGATGLLGSRLTERLIAAGAQVVALVRDVIPMSRLHSGGASSRIDIVHGDVRDQPLLERVLGDYEIDTVFHLAAQTIVGVAGRNPIETLDTNIRGTWTICEAVRRSPLVRALVVASSDKAYGSQASLPYVEEAPLLARSPYDLSKAAADQIALMYAHTFDVPVVTTRCGNLFGGGDLNWNRLIPGAIRSGLAGQPTTLRSDGSLTRDYFFVDDAAGAYMHLARCLVEQPELRGEAFNFSSGESRTALAVARLIMERLGVAGQPVVAGSATGEILHQSLSTDKARRMLGWSSVTPFESALESTIGWYRDFFARQDT